MCIYSLYMFIHILYIIIYTILCDTSIRLKLKLPGWLLNMMMPNDYFVGMGWRNKLCKSSGQLVDLGCRLMCGFRNPAFRFWFQRVPLDTELSEKHVLVLYEDEVGAAWGISLLHYMMMVLLSVMAGLLALKSPSGNMGRRQWDSNDLSQPFKALLWIQWYSGQKGEWSSFMNHLQS